MRSVAEMEKVQENLMANGIKPRRYFALSLDTLCYIEQRKPIAISRNYTSRILVLPLHSRAEIKTCEMMLNTLKKYRQ